MILYSTKAKQQPQLLQDNMFGTPIKSERIILVTGGFDPIHGGHVQLCKEAKSTDPDSLLCVGLNSDEWLIRKKGKYFMNFEERKEVIEALKYVDVVVPFNDDDDTASDAISLTLELYHNVIFCNGGDRGNGTTPEYEKWKHDPRVTFLWGVGGDNKHNSSSWILDRWSQG